MCKIRLSLALIFGSIATLFITQPVHAAEVPINPGESIQAAVDANPADTTFIIKAGEHRMQEVTPKSGNIFQGEAGAIMNGSRLLTDWTFDGTYWKHGNQTQQGQIHGECISGYDGCKYPEDLYINDQPLWQETSLGAVEPGEWYFDYNTDTVYIIDSPIGNKVEISVSRRAFAGSATPVTIKNLIIEKYAIPAQMGAIGDQYPAPNWVIEDNEVRLNHGTGINFSDAAIVRNNFVHHNGQKGIGGGGFGGLVEGNVISYNNYAGFNWGWEGGGTKFAYTDSLTVRNNNSHHNNGPGLWTDISNINTLYEGNLVEYNQSMGIFHEISYAATIRCNTLRYNSVNDFPWLYGGQITISTSKDVEVYNNIVVVDAAGGNGITILNQDRGGDYYSENNYVHDNDITHKGDYGQSGIATDYDHENFWENGNNYFNFNTYHVPNLDGAYWGGSNFTNWQASGQDINGSADTDINFNPSFPSCGGLRDPENPSGTVNGLDYKYYEGTWDMLPDFNSLTPVEEGTAVNFDVSSPPIPDYFGYVFEGYIDAPADGTYTFYTTSDDGSKLHIGSTEVVNNDGLHGMVEQSGQIGLKAGKHAIKVTMFEKTGGHGLEVRWEGPGISKELIPDSTLYRVESGGGSGTILREWWEGIGGTTVSDLTSNPNYPDNPTGSNEPTSFEAPTDWADNYGTRMRGYVHPSSSGDYTFWIAGDDNCELWLSTDDNPANASLIANVPGWTSSREWTKYGEQQSGVIPLTGGQKYYIEALQKEGGGGDNLAVAWQGGGFSQEVIDGSYLSPWIGGGDTTPPAAPTGLTAAAGDAQVSLDWADNTEPDVKGYNVYRSTTSGGGYSQINGSLLSSSDYTDNSVSNGTTYYYVVTAVDTSSNESGYSNEASATPGAPLQDPYQSHVIPGQIEAENYDYGGEGVAYHDNDSGNSGGAYRSDDVDIESCGEGGYNVGWISAGEWLEYTVADISAGTYDIEVRVASNTSGGSLHIEFDGLDVTGPISFSATGGWQDWTSVYVNDVSLGAGQQVMRIAMDSDGFNLNWVKFEAVDTTPPAAPTGLSATPGDATVSLDWNDNSEPDLAGYDVYRSTTSGGPYSVIDFDLTQSDYTDNSVSNGTTYYYVVTAVDTSNNESDYSSQVSATPSPSQAPYGGTAWNIPGKIEAENYDTGGESVAYHDVDADNTGGQYRTDDVDIKVTADTDGGYAVGWFNASEWLEYTVNVPVTGTYDIQSRVGSALEGRTFWIEFNGVNKTGNIDVPQMADWDQYQTVTVPGVSLSAGQQVMRVEMGLLDFMDLNWINIVETADTTPPAAPTGLAAAAGDATVSLDWNDNGEGDLDGYNVYRSTTSGGGYSRINGSLLSSSDYTDNSVSNGTTYYYVVTAVDTSSNESGYSNEASTTPTGGGGVVVFSDSFEVSEWNGLWTEDSQNDWFRSTQRAVDGSYSAEVDGSTSDAVLTSILIDLQGKTNATVTFSWLIEVQLDSGEYLALDVSTNGGSSWVERAILRGNVDPENIWHNPSIDVTGISGGFQIRFRAKMSRSNEDANVDMVEVLAW